MLAEPLDVQLVDARDRERPGRLVAGREQQHDALGLEPAGREAEDIGRRAVEPRRVVEQCQQRLLLGGIGEQRQRADADQESVGRLLVCEAERAA